MTMKSGTPSSSPPFEELEGDGGAAWTVGAAVIALMLTLLRAGWARRAVCRLVVLERIPEESVGWLPRIKKAVPVSDRVLRSQVANKLVVKHKFRGVGSHALSRP